LIRSRLYLNLVLELAPKYLANHGFRLQSISWLMDCIGPGIWTIHKTAWRGHPLEYPRSLTKTFIQHVDFRRKRDGEANLEKAGSAYHALVSGLIS
jgi:hypothetical protein